MASVKVAVRARPLNKREIEDGARVILKMDRNRATLINAKLLSEYKGEIVKDPLYLKEFHFDHTYWSVNQGDANFATQEQIYNDLGADVVSAALSGYNACIFAYGQTGAGKTFTMMGTDKQVGLIPRICEKLFLRLNKSADAVSYRMEASYFEIYNEQVRDLLRPQTSSKILDQGHLKVREHPKEGPFVQGLTVHPVSDYAAMESLMETGNSLRVTASTLMNDTSSRSHAIFTIKFTQAQFSENMPMETTSKVNLVDLAGSERAARSGATGIRLKEGGNINKSLTTLGQVISALADKSQHEMDGKHHTRRHTFIPYRDSVLTWLLKDSLGGNSKTIMVAAVSPSDINYGETLSTLRYASRARKIVNKPVVNEDPNVKLIKELRAEIDRLRELVKERPTHARKSNDQIEAKLAKDEKKADELTEAWMEKWKKTKEILEEGQLSLSQCGRQTLLTSDKPHFVGIDVDPLSPEIVIYQLEEGKTVVGALDFTEEQSIALNSSGIEEEHCHVEVCKGNVYLRPVSTLCYVNNVPVHGERKLRQGDVIQIGHTLKFRFNNPQEAVVLKQKRRSGRFSPEFQTNRSLDSGLSCPEDLEPLASPEEQISEAEGIVDNTIPSFNEETSEETPIQESSRLESPGQESPSLECHRESSQGHDSPKEDTSRFSLEESRDYVRDLLKKYRETEVERLEAERSFREETDQEEAELIKKRRETEQLKTECEKDIKDAHKNLQVFKEKYRSEKELKRRKVEKDVDRLIEIQRKQQPRSTEKERELRKLKFRLRSKIDDHWKRMDLYENLLLGIELDRRKQNSDLESHLSEKEKSTEIDSEDIRSLVEQKRVLQDLLCKHKEAKDIEEEKKKLKMIEIQECEKRYAQRLEQQELLIGELKEQQQLTVEELNKENFPTSINSTGGAFDFSDQDSLDRSLSVLRPEGSLNMLRSEDSSSVQRLEDSLDLSTSPLMNTNWKSPQRKRNKNKLLKRKEKYEELLREAQVSVDHLQSAKKIEIEKLQMDLADEEVLSEKIIRRIETDQNELNKVEDEIKMRSMSVEELLRTTSFGANDPSSLKFQKKQLIRSRAKVQEVFESNLKQDLREVKVLESEPERRKSWFGPAPDPQALVTFTAEEEILNSISDSVEFGQTLEDIAAQELTVTTLNKKLSESKLELNEIDEKHMKLQQNIFRELESRKMMAEASRISHYEDISRSVEQLVNIAGGKHPGDKIARNFTKQSQDMLKIRQKLDELERRVIFKRQKNKELEVRMSKVRERIDSSGQSTDLDNDDCSLELEMKDLEFQRDRCDSEIEELQEKLEKERNDYLDILKCQDEYIIIGQEYRNARQLMLRVLGNQAAADLQKELSDHQEMCSVTHTATSFGTISCEMKVFCASNALDLIELGMNAAESPICGGWRPYAKEKDVTILRKSRGRSGIQSFVGCGIIKASPRVVWEAVRNPLSRYIYDSLLKKMNVIEHIDEHLKVVYMRHEGRVCILKHARDFCCVHSERTEHDMFIAASQSVEHPDCPVTPGVGRAQVFPSGWAVEPYVSPNGREWSQVWYVIKVDLGKGLPSSLINFLCKRLPLSIAFLRNYLVLS